MNTYRSESPNHRPVIMLVAAAMTASSLALAVVVPALHEPMPGGAQAPHVAKHVAPPEPVTVTIDPARIDVVGRRTQETALDEPSFGRSGRKS